jgi:hypothetical protein
MSSIKVNLIPPIRRVAADPSSSITLDCIISNERINTLSQILSSIKKILKNSYNLVKQSTKKRIFNHQLFYVKVQLVHLVHLVHHLNQQIMIH